MLIKRDLLLQKLIQYRDKDIVKVITGIRRCGKSVLLNEIYYSYLVADGVQDDHIIRISFDMKRWEHLRTSDALYRYLCTAMAGKGPYYVFLDEIQLVEGFESVVNDLASTRKADVYVTGSNSRLLSHEISTLFRGRGIEIKVFPLSFAEYYAYRQGDKQDALDAYIQFGGLPYVVQEPNEEEKRSYLDMVFRTTVLRDVIDRYNVRNPDLFISVAKFLCSAIGSPISASRIANTLRDSGFRSADNESVSRYLGYLLDAFLFYKADRYDLKGRQYLKTQSKYYVADIGLRNAATGYRQIEITHIMENLVYIELLRRGYLVDIGKNREKEIDFVARKLDGRLCYIQVSYSLREETTKERELSAFRLLDDGYKKLVITLDRNPLQNLERGYLMLNLFDFLLDEHAIEHL